MSAFSSERGDTANMDDHHDTTPDPDCFTDTSHCTQFVDTSEPQLELPAVPTAPTPTSTSKEDSPTATTPQHIKAIKPDRVVTRNVEGKFICTWPGCAEESIEFTRKSEWNKHMDKHDRPFKCAAEGCEKLTGFTYSGGLLRHEREVHGKHEGPKNSFYCPHANCRRHSGKGFSRQENLKEHLRRVHTQNGAALNGGDGETDDGASDHAATAGGGGVLKRKRDDRAGGGGVREEIKHMREEMKHMREEIKGVREEMKRVRQENEEPRQENQEPRRRV